MILIRMKAAGSEQHQARALEESYTLVADQLKE